MCTNNPAFGDRQDENSYCCCCLRLVDGCRLRSPWLGGATQKVVAVGNDVSAYGYPSTVEKDEMRAERITVDGKSYEMR